MLSSNKEQDIKAHKACPSFIDLTYDNVHTYDDVTLPTPKEQDPEASATYFEQEQDVPKKQEQGRKEGEEEEVKVQSKEASKKEGDEEEIKEVSSKDDGEEEEVNAKKVVEQTMETENIKVRNLHLHLPTPNPKLHLHLPTPTPTPTPNPNLHLHHLS